jgi:hypothetical protein
LEVIGDSPVIFELVILIQAAERAPRKAVKRFFAITG